MADAGQPPLPPPVDDEAPPPPPPLASFCRKRPVSLVWLRRDLRLDDNPALTAALKTGGDVVVVFIWAPEEEGQFQPGRCNRWWLHNSLKSLAAAVRKLGSRLILRAGTQSLAALVALVEETGASAVFFNHLYDPVALVRDNTVKTGLKALGVGCDTFNADLLYEPWELYHSDGGAFTQFEPFWAKLLGMLYEPDLPSLAPKALPPPPASLASLALEELALMAPDEAPSNDLLGRRWTPGEEAARTVLDDFLAERLREYSEQRALTDTAGTSSLSPHLHFGEVSVRRIWYQTKQMEWLWAQSGLASASVGAFQRSLGLREFGRYLAFHFPFTHERALLEPLRAFPWRYAGADYKAWRCGVTGYPFVDAGMRQLWATGWLHNRVRAAVSAFLVRHLLLPWQWGLKHYWDTLLDADLESAVLGWQYVAGGLPDSPPLAGAAAEETLEAVSRRHDPHGHYVRRWIPQLARLPTEWLHAPWQAPAAVLAAAGVELGGNYPHPIVAPAAAALRLKEALAQLLAANAASSGADGGVPPAPHGQPTGTVEAAAELEAPRAGQHAAAPPALPARRRRSSSPSGEPRAAEIGGMSWGCEDIAASEPSTLAVLQAAAAAAAAAHTAADAAYAHAQSLAALAWDPKRARRAGGEALLPA